jgi:glycosyltransferase involved in cell wall biosynthesis
VALTLLDGGIPEEKIDIVYDGVALPPAIAEGTRVLAPATSDPMKGSDLVREAARIADVPIEFSTSLQQDLPEAALLVYITRSEGLGSAALLAMAHGVPVVASDVGGLPEIGVSALVGNDPEQIAAAIARVLKDGPSARQSARRRIEERFTVERMADDTRAAYRKAAAT